MCFQKLSSRFLFVFYFVTLVWYEYCLISIMFYVKGSRFICLEIVDFKALYCCIGGLWIFTPNTFVQLNILCFCYCYLILKYCREWILINLKLEFCLIKSENFPFDWLIHSIPNWYNYHKKGRSMFLIFLPLTLHIFLSFSWQYLNNFVRIKPTVNRSASMVLTHLSMPSSKSRLQEIRVIYCLNEAPWSSG